MFKETVVPLGVTQSTGDWQSGMLTNCEKTRKIFCEACFYGMLQGMLHLWWDWGIVQMTDSASDFANVLSKQPSSVRYL